MRAGGRRTARGRSWRTIAGEAWGTDILRERSFVFLVWSRFFILGGSAFLIALSVPYLERALGLVDSGDRADWLLIVTIVGRRRARPSPRSRPPSSPNGSGASG